MDYLPKVSTRPVPNIAPLITTQTTRPRCARVSAISSSTFGPITPLGNVCPIARHSLTCTRTMIRKPALSHALMECSLTTGLVPAYLPSTAPILPSETLIRSAAWKSVHYKYLVSSMKA
jgi:hypothetical protein